MRAFSSIKTKLLLVALLLLLIPWMSYIYVRDMKAFLLSGQENALSLTSRAIATVLHDRPELFTENNSVIIDEAKSNDIYANPLPNYINLNGDLSDWGEQLSQMDYFPEKPEANTQAQQVGQMLGYHGRYIYVVFQIKDEAVLFRPSQYIRLDAADHIRLSLKNPGLPARNYILSMRQAGRMSIYQVDKDFVYPITGEPNYDLAAEMRITDNGYNVELRIPRFILTSNTKISLAVVDVDNQDNRAIKSVIPTTAQSDTDELSRILVQSPEIAKILKGLDRKDARIWVIDKNKKVRTVVGNINTDAPPNIKPTRQDSWWRYQIDSLNYYYKRSLQYIFNLIIEKPTQSLQKQDSIEARNDEVIQKALNGLISYDRRLAADEEAVILMSAHPVYLGDNVLGAVVVEQSTNQILQQQYDILENVISVSLLVLITVITALLIFASRLTVRIRRLRDAADHAIDNDGRIVQQKLSPEQKARDEIGDLSRSISNMLDRLSQYTSYLKGLPDTLAHEVSNPLNVVNSSLHNLSEEQPTLANSKYMERAKNGIARIGGILRNLTEAANLEQAMQSESKEPVNLVELIESYMDGYAFSNPSQKFALTIENQPLFIHAAPDYIAQALDKLVDNAMDFAAPNTPITFVIQGDAHYAMLDVMNYGTLLPDDMSERIFEPLVSINRTDAKKTRLGMGLYIVKLIVNFHGGKISAQNLEDRNGVKFSLLLPLSEINDKNASWETD